MRHRGHETQERAASARRTELADLVAEGMSLKDASQHFGVSEARIWQMWAIIKRGLGEQAQ